jgi:nucleotide-binding universal stress UspA family protein
MTTTFAHIACCIDQSDASMQALDQAVRLHESGGGRLSFLHVAAWPYVVAGHGASWVPDPTIILAGVKEWLDGVVASHPGTDGVLLEGYPSAVACDWAAEAGVDLIVAASSRGLFDRVLLGSFAGYLARHAPCAVLLTRPEPVHVPVGSKEDAERGSVE